MSDLRKIAAELKAAQEESSQVVLEGMESIGDRIASSFAQTAQSIVMAVSASNGRLDRIDNSVKLLADAIASSASAKALADNSGTERLIQILEEMRSTSQQELKVMEEQGRRSIFDRIARREDAKEEQGINKEIKENPIKPNAGIMALLLQAAALGPLGAVVFGSITMTMKAMSDTAEAVDKWADQIVQGVIGLGAIFTPAVKSIGKMMKGFDRMIGAPVAKLVGAVTGLTRMLVTGPANFVKSIPVIGTVVRTFFNTLGSAAKPLITTFKTIGNIVATPFRILGKMFAPLAAIITLVDTVGPMIRAWRDGEGLFGIMIAGVNGFFNSIWTTIKGITQIVRWGVKKLAGFFGLGDTVQAAYDEFDANFSEFAEAWNDSGPFGIIMAGFKLVAQTVWQGVRGVFNIAKSAVKGLAGLFGLGDHVQAVYDTVGWAMGSIGRSLVSIKDSVVSWFANFEMPDLYGTITRFVNLGWDWITSPFRAARSIFQSVPSPEDIMDMDIIQGTIDTVMGWWKSIQDGFDSLVNRLKKVANWIPGVEFEVDQDKAGANVFEVVMKAADKAQKAQGLEGMQKYRDEAVRQASSGSTVISAPSTSTVVNSNTVRQNVSIPASSRNPDNRVAESYRF